jgi:hypothetical protein
MNSRNVEFDRAKLVRLKRAYEKAKMKEEQTFVLDDREYLIDFAKYLIEYLEKQLK